MRIDQPLLKLPRRYCAETLAAEIAALPSSAWIPHPGRLTGNDAVPLITPGGEITNAFAGPMAPTEHLLKCGYIMEIMADLGGVWGRSRLMGLAPGAEVPEHVDVGYYWRTHLRVHIPVITTPDVLFTCDGETVHMAPGECWVFDSFRMHNVKNGGTKKRVHLVLDTVGGERLWDLVAEARETRSRDSAATLNKGQRSVEGLAFEQINAPEIMSPWEVRCHVDYLLRLAPAGPALDAVAQRLDRFANGWTAIWAQFGASVEAAPEYRRLIDGIQAEMVQLRAHMIVLPNQVPVDRALSELVFQIAVPSALARPQGTAANSAPLAALRA